MNLQVHKQKQKDRLEPGKFYQLTPDYLMLCKKLSMSDFLH